MFLLKAHNSAQDDLELSCQEKKLIIERSVSKELVKSIPWRLVLSKPPVCALIASHFCYNWGIFILLTWMPTCYNQVSHPIYMLCCSISKQLDLFHYLFKIVMVCNFILEVSLYVLS